MDGDDTQHGGGKRKNNSATNDNDFSDTSNPTKKSKSYSALEAENSLLRQQLQIQEEQTKFSEAQLKKSHAEQEHKIAQLSHLLFLDSQLKARYQNCITQLQHQIESMLQNEQKLRHQMEGMLQNEQIIKNHINALQNEQIMRNYINALQEDLSARKDESERKQALIEYFKGKLTQEECSLEEKRKEINELVRRRDALKEESNELVRQEKRHEIELRNLKKDIGGLHAKAEKTKKEFEEKEEELKQVRDESNAAALVKKHLESELNKKEEELGVIQEDIEEFSALLNKDKRPSTPDWILGADEEEDDDAHEGEEGEIEDYGLFEQLASSRPRGFNTQHVNPLLATTSTTASSVFNNPNSELNAQPLIEQPSLGATTTVTTIHEPTVIAPPPPFNETMLEHTDAFIPAVHLPEELFIFDFTENS